MDEFELIDKSFDRTRSSANYHLAVLADLGGFAFTILDQVKMEHIFFSRFEKDVKQHGPTDPDWFEEQFSRVDYFKDTYKSTSFIYGSQRSTLVPGPAFQAERLKEYVTFNLPLGELDEIHYNYIPAIQSFNVFTLPTYLANIVYGLHKETRFYHQATPFIQGIISGLGNKNGIHISLDHGFFDIAIKEGGALKLYNSFQYQDENDLIYFILFVTKQINLDPGKQTTTLSGPRSADKKLIQALREYMPDLEYLEPTFPSLSPDLKPLAAYRYFNLLYLFHCA